MADLEKTVAIIFDGVDQMGSGVTSVTRQLDSVSSSVQQAAQPLADFSLAVLKVEGALLAAGAAVTTLAIKTAGDFDANFRSITTLLDDSSGSLDELRGGLLDYARDSTQSIDTITDAYFDLISAGNDTEEALTLLAAAEQLAVGGATDLKTAGTALAGTLSAYGAEATDAESFTDAFFVAMKGGITTIDELANALPQITGLAAQLGVPFEELAAGVSALTTTGLSTSQAVTQVGSALTAILGPSSQAKSLAEELGIEFNATALRTHGLAGFLEILEEATGGSEEKMKTLFGSVEATKGVLSLTGPVADAFADGLGNMEERAGATAEAVEKMAGTVDQGTQRIKNAMTVALVGLGLPLLDEFSGIQSAIAEIFNAIGVSLTDGQLKQFVDQIESVFASLEATLYEVAANLPEALETADWSGFLNGVEAIREAIRGLFDGADITTAEGLASVIETLGTAFQLLSEYTAGTITAIGPFIEKLADLAQWIMKIDPEYVAMLGTIGGGAIVLTTALSAFSSMLSIMNSLAGAKGAIPAVTGAAGKLTGALSTKGGLGFAAIAASGALLQLYNEMKEFNEFRFNFSDELKAELDETTGAQKVATEFSLFQVQKLAEAYVGLSDFFGWGDEAAKDFNTISQEAVNAAIAVSNFSEKTGGVEGAVNQTSRSVLDGFSAWQEWTSAAEAATRASEATDQAYSTNAKTLGDYITNIENSSGAWEKLNGNTYQAVDNSEAVEEALAKVNAQFTAGMIDESTYDGLVARLEDLRVGGDAGGKSLQALGESANDAGEKAKKTADQLFDLEKTAMELASNERIKGMEFSVDFKIAEMEADTKKVEAILGATSTTIEATAGSIDGLFSSLAGGDLSRFQELDLEKAVDQQLKIQGEAAEQQKKLIDAQIKNLRAKTEALRNGDGLIKIDSTGLEPALEMIMWEILEKVQLRANAEGAEFLLGIEGGA
ncbi:phage tail tape measure protein [Halomonas sp. LBP4]|uniref:phage tail tape measure protein n=1 Tax=Halomonas sp. LBP4 TaxID=2044917 RepID=UPI000D76100E|nr:phage tail tape measure protein [Halomonas sp. LBP4]PXX94994.1 phage tail tape measure protein [Halomonas sp. LBP4]